MANISAADVKKLREKTGAGLMDCKKALAEANGDFAAAEKHLKELGLAAAAKKSGRATNEGRIFTRIEGDKAVILELSCETDFVARNDTFIKLGRDLAGHIIEKGLNESDTEMEAMVKETISTIKENMGIRRFKLLEKNDSERFVDYIHGESGNIGVIVRLGTEPPEAIDHETVKQFSFDTALHVAAFNPQFLSPETVDEQYLKEQEEIFLTQAKNMGKPEKVIQGIVQGKLKKHLSEICLTNQAFVKDDKKSLSQVAQEVGKEAGAEVKVLDFAYYSVGQE
ncbi:MAG: translation elongation factor Ts [Spirochaetaceae bacterium]